MAHIYGIFTYGIYTYGEKTRTRGQLSHGELTSLHLSESRGKWTAGLTAGLGRRRTDTPCKGVWPFLRKGLEWLTNSEHLWMPHPTTEVGQSLVMKSEEACTLQWDHGLLQSLDKEGRKKRKLWIWWFWGKCELATSLWVSSSEVINHSDLTGSALKLKEATSARGISRWSSYGKDLAPRLSARARTSLCFFPFRALSPILAWNLFRGGEDVPSPDPCIKTHYWKIPGVRGGLKKKKV